MSAFSLPSIYSRVYIPVYAGVQLIVCLCVNLDAASLMTLVVVFNYKFPLLSIFKAVNESVVCLIMSLVPLASSSDMRMAVISTPKTDAESLSLIIISSSLCTTDVATIDMALEPSV